MQSNLQLKKDIVIHISLNYLLYLPKSYSNEKNKKFPLILFLHGAGEIGDDIEMLRVQALPAILETKEDFPFIVVSPQCPPDSSWHYEFNALDELLQEIIENIMLIPIEFISQDLVWVDLLPGTIQ